jgi:anti-sigma regulatory factor (Ser/Thr protein kinase)
MRVGASAGHVGHFHEAAFYASDDEFRQLIVPFVEEGLDAGEPVIIGYDERKSTLLRGWLPSSCMVTYITDADLYATPAGAIANYRKLFAQHVADGAHQIRIAGDVPHADNVGRFGGWDRYESAVNTVWGEYPVRSVCLYDAATVSTEVRDVVERTHPRLLSATGERRANRRFEDSSIFVGLPATLDVIEASAPLVEISNATAAQARHAVRRVGSNELDENTLSDLVLAVSEAVTNALVHGKPPTLVQIWTEADRVVIHVWDSGQGPTHRHAGLIPVTDSVRGAGLGLWLVHQLDVDVDLMPAPDGFTIRLRADRATPGQGEPVA